MDESSKPLELVEDCVEIYHCGTEAPIWLDGTHPIGTVSSVEKRYKYFLIIVLTCTNNVLFIDLLIVVTVRI